MRTLFAEAQANVFSCFVLLAQLTMCSLMFTEIKRHLLNTKR